MHTNVYSESSANSNGSISHRPVRVCECVLFFLKSSIAHDLSRKPTVKHVSNNDRPRICFTSLQHFNHSFLHRFVFTFANVPINRDKNKAGQKLNQVIQTS